MTELPFVDDEMTIEQGHVLEDVPIQADAVEGPMLPPEMDAEIHDLAWEVLRGEHGRGEQRKQSLGNKYEIVMAEVQRIRLQNGTN